MADKLLGQRFNYEHGGGVTRYQVDRAHRTAGFYECVAVRAISGSHHFIGSIQAFSRREILSALAAVKCSCLERPDVVNGFTHDADCDRRFVEKAAR